MARSSMSIEEVLTLLRENPVRIAALTSGLKPAQLRAAPSPGEWSVNEVLGHLRSCADARGDVMPTFLAQERPTLRAIDPRAWIKQTNYLELEFAPSFEAFARQRAQLLAILEPLPPEAWSRAATFTGSGPPRERTLLFYGAWVAGHEQVHVKHIGRIVRALAASAATTDR